MLKRLITALGLVAILAMALFWWRQASLLFVDLFIVLFALLGTYEILRSFKTCGFQTLWLPVIVTMSIIYPLTYFFQEKGIMIAMFTGAILGLVNFTFKRRYEIQDLMTTLFALIYPLSIMMMLVIMNHTLGGLLAILLVILISVMTDTMAYFTGSIIKGKKLCPEISPKKTIAGAVGGLIGGLIGATIVFLLFDYAGLFDGVKNIGTVALLANWKVALPIYLVAGLAGGVMCELGDLAASWMKRKAGIKDFGKIFPGHGGVMDRLDGILFVIPVVYVVIECVFRFG